ncbi:NmrA family NAD(P)-binding protein [Dyadobacter chenhuakuii]|uniref:NmrA family NAD(P)-binding protein n=1 Tax=Dyadobacter chenhuakuii TaxID=2909339 RepID=A0A9X1U0F9_9BACT|nr:NmrA family NAD(P)-binding protein [Dyadobacter chenhuakuii]MCF2498221.1 NmrA family NAD(P)-binding protein [Dyadobacter chenhuakuii]
MYIILGATGHVGSAVAETLLGRGEAVTVVTRDAEKAEKFRQKGAVVAVADVHDVESLRRVFRTGTRLFLLNPPALPDTDTIEQERRSLASIIAALEGSGLQKIVGLSTYGVHDGEGVGDLGVLYEMEQKLSGTHIPFSIVRAAYYMSNWDGFLQTAESEGKIYSLYPADFALPMVAPEEIGKFAAELLTEPVERTGLYYIEGPDEYTPADVADAFAQALAKPVEVEVIPRTEWIPFLKNSGFSQKAAESMAAMTDVTLEEKYEVSDSPMRGEISIHHYVKQMLKAAVSNPAL